MNILPLSAFKDNYIWLFSDLEQQHAAVVDPGDATAVFEYLNTHNLSLSYILLTHHHNDHVGGVASLVTAYPEVVIYGVQDSRLPYSIVDTDLFSVFNYQFKRLTTPGHTCSHVCFFEPHAQVLFCGDTLFSAGCGRVFDGTIEQLYDSIQQLKALPDTTRIFCGHEYTRENLAFALHVEPDNQRAAQYLKSLTADNITCSLPSTIALEKQINPFFRLNYCNHMLVKMPSPPNNFDNELSIFELLRDLKNNFTS